MTLTGVCSPQYMKQHIPGNPNLIVQKHAGRRASLGPPPNYIYNVAPKDGHLHRGRQRDAGDRSPGPIRNGLKFDPRQFRWLGQRAAREPCRALPGNLARVKIARRTSSRTSSSSPAPAAPTNFYPLFVDAILGAKMKMIPGYQGTKAGHAGPWSGGEVGGRRRHHPGRASRPPTAAGLRDDKIRAFIQFGLKEATRSFPDVSWIYDYAPPTRRIAPPWTSPSAIRSSAVPSSAPPGVPDEVVNILRDAFEGHDARSRSSAADAERRARSISRSPRGAEIQSLIDKNLPHPACGWWETRQEKSCKARISK